ncbi:MAG TPA: vWA domain-containing protein [Kofleriaceae bacterium]|nr:vWA domain-containing protein [Kofleriaceae bacterium]
MTDRPRPSSLVRWLRRHSLTAVAALGGAVGVAYAAHHATPPPRHDTSIQTIFSTINPGKTADLPRDKAVDTVQIALLLDTSSSMDGLINQARSHLWNIVEQMGQMTRVVDGKLRGVKVELALYEYGNSTISPADGYIRQILPLTGDLDKVSEALFRLSTDGGDEYPGEAITVAARDLAWSNEPGALKFVFVAGNETFDQGPISAATAMKAAAARDIHVQLVFCGNQDASWDSAAKLASSDLTTIDQDAVAQQIAAPQDAEILRLGQQLNGTYLAYGVEGAAAAARQAAADASSAHLGAKVAIERSQLKAKGSYNNAGWDVIDATNGDGDFLGKADDAELPPELRGKSLEEKKQIVAAKAAERAAIQAQIGKLEAERAGYLAKQQPQTGEGKMLDTQLLDSTRKVAVEKGWKL